jgi:hypothetical protein
LGSENFLKAIKVYTNEEDKFKLKEINENSAALTDKNI